MLFSLSAAAKATGKGKSTIHNAIRSGKLSAARNGDGTYAIDASELARVFSLNPSKGSRMDDPEPAGEPSGTELAVLRTKVEMLTALLDRERQATAELRQVIALLPKPVPSEPQEPAKGLGFLARLLGR